MKCPCHSGLEYSKCCEPYHKGKNAPTPHSLMRSRYSAYALALADYIIETTHPDNPDYKVPAADRRAHILVFSKNTQFTGLDILEALDDTVTFRAHLVQKGQDVSFTEKSAFAQIDHRWLYLKPLTLST